MKNTTKSQIIVTVTVIVSVAIGVILYSRFFNKSIVDLNYRFDYAVISLQNGEVIEGSIKSWKDYDGEQLQVVMEDGTVYLTNSFNCTLIKKNS